MGSPNLKKPSKQALLKGLLLLALGANLSGGWAPALKSIDLSSNGEAMSSKPTGVPAPEAPVAAPAAPNPNAAGPSDQGPKPDAPATANSQAVLLEKAPKTETQRICGHRFSVTYREVALKDVTVTEILVRPHMGAIPGFKNVTYRPPGGFDVNLDDESIKKENDSEIAANIRKQLEKYDSDTAVGTRKQTKSCDEDSTDTQPADVDSKETKEDRERIKVGMRECRVNSQGDALTESEVTRCQLRRLSEIDADPSNRNSRAKALREIEALVKGDLRKSIKNRLLSSDESKVEEGEQLLADVLDEVEVLGTDLELDPARVAKLKNELDSLRVGGETYRRSATMADQVKEEKKALLEELRYARAEVQLAGDDKVAAFYAKQRELEVQQQIMMRQRLLDHQLQTEIGTPYYMRMDAARRMGLMTSSDFSLFAQPYNSLRSDILGMLDINKMLSIDTSLPGSVNPNPVSISFPSDFSTYRNNLASTGFKRDFGMGYTDRSAVPSLGTYGLTSGMTSSFGAPTHMFDNNNFSNLNLSPMATQPTIPNAPVGGGRF